VEQVAGGMAWKEISRQWDGQVSSKAISEAIQLAKHTLFKNGRVMKKSA
jgi:hypothetical protein